MCVVVRWIISCTKAKYTHRAGGQTALFHCPLHSATLFIFSPSVSVAIFGKSVSLEREPHWDWYSGRPQVCQLSKTRPMHMLCLACQSRPAPWSICLIYFTGKLKEKTANLEPSGDLKMNYSCNKILVHFAHPLCTVQYSIPMLPFKEKGTTENLTSGQINAELVMFL